MAEFMNLFKTGILILVMGIVSCWIFIPRAVFMHAQGEVVVTIPFTILLIIQVLMGIVVVLVRLKPHLSERFVVFHMVYLFVMAEVLLFVHSSGVAGWGFLLLCFLIAKHYNKQYVLLTIGVAAITILVAWTGSGSNSSLTILGILLFALLHCLVVREYILGEKAGYSSSEIEEKIGSQRRDSSKTPPENKNITDQRVAIELTTYLNALTDTELDVLRTMCIYGITSDIAIGEFMNKSPLTIKTHIRNIFEKTNIHKRANLVIIFKDYFVRSREES